MKITLAESSGFCFGVDQAVKTAYDVLKEHHPATPIFMYGEITHNDIVVSDLCEKGMRLVHSVDEVLPGSIVLIRAHGIPPDVRNALEQKECKVVDCTCPFVSKIHAIVKDMSRQGHPVIIAGAPGHPEVVGICGEATGNVRVVSSAEEIKALEITPDTLLIAQTTFSADEFDEIRDIVKEKIANEQIFDTICSTTGNRQREASALASESDCMIVIGSAASSNTMRLFDVCKGSCARTFLISDVQDLETILLDPDFLLDDFRVGVTAGASTPDCIIREVIRTMSENQASANQEHSDINFGDYVDNIPQLRKNATVRGAITSADNEFVYVDVHDKSEGRIPRHEFSSDPDFDLEAAIEEHKEIEVYVRSVRNSDMGKEILLSKAHVDFGKYKDQVEEAYENKTPITVKVTNVVKDGVIANFGGVDIYIHRTQLDLVTVDDLDSYRGKALEILVTQFDPDKRRLRVSGSRRALLNTLRKEKASELWEKIEVGDKYEGIVRSLTDFGAFVDIGGVDGLVHVSELSWTRIRHPSEIVSVGDKVEVYVKDFDTERKRISLGYKKPEDDPYHNVEERFPVGSIVHGKVVRMFQFGAFIELAPGLDALCHVSQISNVRLNKPDDVLSEGMEIVARVLDVNNDTRRISVSIKEVEPIDPEYGSEDSDESAVKEKEEPSPVDAEKEEDSSAAAEDASSVDAEETTAADTEEDVSTVADEVLKEDTEEQGPADTEEETSDATTEDVTLFEDGPSDQADSNDSSETVTTEEEAKAEVEAAPVDDEAKADDSDESEKEEVESEDVAEEAEESKKD
ncbi:MAG: bifunctional 4-hydroxy-3-methylbut-2-enyl diphosphate reductase/30S ribosomal protein S1 [Clostridiales bacterium]|nr:bifunctional 4-hydroxy-3-methylbut-2-enyl diphosphate reductase/30S ribosomal protein S1 [Clostridiales bacterium]